MKFAQLSVIAVLLASTKAMSFGDLLHPFALVQSNSRSEESKDDAEDDAEDVEITENLNATAPVISDDLVESLNVDIEQSA